MLYILRTVCHSSTVYTIYQHCIVLDHNLEMCIYAVQYFLLEINI